MLIIADLSGIQDYLFQVRETGGKQARSLRYRSLFIQLVSEAVGIRLIAAAGLEEKRIIFSAAGKIAIDGAGLTADELNRMHKETRQIETWLRDKTHARLRVSVVSHDRQGQSIAQQYLAAGLALQNAKLRGWSRVAAAPDGWQSSELLAAPPDPDAEADHDAELGRQVVQPGNHYILFGNPETGPQAEQDWDVVGLHAHFSQSAPPAGNAHHSRELSRLVGHVPRRNGEAIEFVDLAGLSRGAPMLGVLKADADSLGAAIAQRLRESSDLAPLRDLSIRLGDFFARELNEQIEHDPRWEKLYVVFSGGDDILLVGPWDIAIDFAQHLSLLFSRHFQRDSLTLSAGVAIVKPKFPIRLAAQQAGHLLEQAKSGTKDQCAALGGVWRWDAHEPIIDAGKQLADWVDAGVIQRGWLHTLLELALLQRGEGRSRSEQLIPAMAGSRMAYHVARNWPAASKPGEPGTAARRWIDTLLQHFNLYPNTTDPIAIHLPSILRYAMLATRSSSDKE